MVNLRESEDVEVDIVEVRRPVLDGGFRRRGHRIWGARFGRRREEMRGREPITLHDLECLTNRALAMMETHGPKSKNNYFLVMDLLRVQYNLVSNFHNF